MALACTGVGWTKPFRARLVCKVVERGISEKVFINKGFSGNQRAREELLTNGRARYDFRSLV